MTARTPGQDPASAPSAADRDRLAAVTAAVVDGSVRTPGTPARTTVFDAVRADQDGPVTQALISLTDKHCPAVRRTALTLLGELTFGRRTPWQGPIDAAAARLHDPDPDARRAAAQLLVRAGGADRARTALDELTDPVTRIALANALLHTPDTPCPPGPLRADPLPEIRLLACIEELATAPRERWPALDAQAEAEVAALTAADTDRIRPNGLRWGSALFRQDRERHCYALATRLLAGAAGPYGQRVGVDLARRAFQGWRAAPGTLTPHLVRLLPTAPPDLRDRVVDTLCASRTATRLTADDLAALLPAGNTAADTARDTAADTAWKAAADTAWKIAADTAWKIACALAVIDDPRAAPYVHARMASGDPPTGAVAAVRGLLRSGTADPSQLVPRLRELLRSGDSDVVHAAASITGDLGPAAAACVPELIEALRAECAARDALGAEWATWRELCLVASLGRIGPPAAAALPLLEGLTRDSRRRAGHRALALSRITGDRRHIESYLRSRPQGRRYVPDHSALFLWLLDHGGLDPDQSRRLRTYVLERAGATQVYGSLALWRHEGPPAAGELLALLSQYLDDDLFGPVAMDTLAAMGEHARPALPRLRELIDRTTRIPLCNGSEDAEMDGDERLLEAASRTVAALTAPAAP
ncbi:hypothetical protein ACTPOK_34215 [Streptomyces inhibens]|uniref:hypothetical protein n=1 Tax=Streptomyces inhibens TaxID=2293571 RepID=UPI00402AFB67